MLKHIASFNTILLAYAIKRCIKYLKYTRQWQSFYQLWFLHSAFRKRNMDQLLGIAACNIYKQISNEIENECTRTCNLTRNDNSRKEIKLCIYLLHICTVQFTKY